MHASRGSSDTPFPNPMHMPLPSRPALPIFLCKLHVPIRFLILHFLQMTLSPTVHPLFLAKYAAHPRLSPVSLHTQSAISAPHTSQFTRVITVLVIASLFPSLQIHVHLVVILPSIAVDLVFEMLQDAILIPFTFRSSYLFSFSTCSPAARRGETTPSILYEPTHPFSGQSRRT